MRIVQKKICLLGNFAVGKTSLVRRFVDGRFDDKYLSTIGVKISRKTLERESHRLNLIIWDLAGGEKYVKYQPNYLRGAEGALVVCDLTRKDTLDCLEDYLQQIQEINPEVAAVLIGNKLDLKDQHEFSPEDLTAVSTSLGFPSWVTSAKTGKQVEAAFEGLADLIQKRS